MQVPADAPCFHRFAMHLQWKESLAFRGLGCTSVARQPPRCSRPDAGLPEGRSQLVATARFRVACQRAACVHYATVGGGGPLIVPAGWCRSCWPGGGAVFPEGSGCSQFACTGVTEQARSVPSTRPARSSRLTPKSAWSNGHLCGALFRCSFSADIIHCCQFLFLLLSSQAPALARHIVFTQDITLLEIYFMQRCTQMQQVML